MATNYEYIAKLLLSTENSCLRSEAVTEGSCRDDHCGDELVIFFKTEREIITGIGFTIEESSCEMSKACASWIIQEAKDKAVMAAYTISYKDIEKSFGGLEAGDVHCAMMAEIALKQAIINYSKIKRKEAENV